MPIYAFQCQDCGHAFDRLQKFSDPDPSACPSCGADRVARQVTAPAFRLAGSGWYETDFKRKGEARRNLADHGAESGAATSGDASGTASTAAAKPVGNPPAPSSATGQASGT